MIKRIMPPSSDRSNLTTLGALGMLSGAISWALINLAEQSVGKFDLGWDWLSLSPFSIYPGLVFGLVIGALFYRHGNFGGLRMLGYVLAAGLAYCGAFNVAANVTSHFPHAGGDPSHSVTVMAISGIGAGIVGSFLLGLTTIFLLRVPGRLVLRLPVLVGGAAGVLLGNTAHDNSKWGWSYIALFALWQGAYAASLAPLLRGTTRK